MKKIYCLFIILLLAFYLNAQTPLTTAVDFTATDVHGTSHNLFTYLDAGKYVFIDFFYTTCGTCQSMAPQGNASYIYFGCNQGDVIFLGIDDGDSDAEVINFDNQFGIDYPTISGDKGGTTICNNYGITAYPTYILIAPNRNIVVQDMWPFSTAICNSTLESYGIQSLPCQTSINDLLAKTIAIYPIPAQSELFIDIQNNKLTNPILSIYDVTGQIIYLENLKTNNAVHTINTSLINNGSYILQIVDNSEVIFRKLISIAH
ncbi:MAG TPA: T9SS type A sorting domain-containing protein [Bacteroidales bacterium]|nr:T9SS type A sorting domain-containing protein [Bacteroidales bacterium]